MTTSVTQREIGLGIGKPSAGAVGRSNAAVSTRAPARACARIPSTLSIGKVWALILFVAGSGRIGAGRWWALTARPLSLRAMWRLSGVEPARVPAGSTGWTRAWRWSNRTDRWLMFALVLLAPTVLTGPLRWIAVRPTRRVGFYLLTSIFIVFVLI